MTYSNTSSPLADRFNSYQFKKGDRSWIFHPLVLFSAVWTGVALLYSLRLSNLLFYTTAETLEVIEHLLFPFFLAALVYLGLFYFSNFAWGSNRIQLAPNFQLLTSRLRKWFLFWVVISLIEIVVSGGIPILWLVQGSSKTYMDFGIPTVHGFMNSLLLSIALSYAALYGILKRKRYLFLPAFVMLWSVLAVTRNMMIVIVLEVSLILLQLSRVRFTTVIKILIGASVLILVFGFIGDLRTGGEAFRLLAQPTKNYPDWLPSGLLWGYIYLVTPLNNLVHTIQRTEPLYSYLFPNTLSTLLPSVFRSALFGSQSTSLGTGDLVTGAFNVSTAYAGPFQDFGYQGVSLFSSFVAIISMFFWKRTNLRDLLIYTVLAQCLVLSIFYDHFLYLPIVSQVGWLAIFFMPQVRFGHQN